MGEPTNLGRWILRSLDVQGRDRARCCDAAIASELDGWRVLVVADGVSSRAHTHFGAHLTSRVALRAALHHLLRGGPVRLVPSAIQTEVGAALRAALCALGDEEARLALPCTLVLLVVGAQEAAAWFCGDGDAALVGLPDDVQLMRRVGHPPSGLANRTMTTSKLHHAVGDSTTEARVIASEDAYAVHWRRRGEVVSGLPCSWAFPEQRPAQMLPAFHAIGDLAGLRGAFVATDGLSEEGAQLLLASPAVMSSDLHERVRGASDDVGVAWGGSLATQVLRDAATPQHVGDELELSLRALGLSDSQLRLGQPELAEEEDA
ncbi:protein phosphatase 2C domain-containing protein [Nannocystis bainbridge]|uniref:Protein phosphatase 2C domain-containing protein n=1 Tax=Nannocystis bainbridge TaxID=2995303 RepID=A0ABT5E3T3_9BACT|nr:protein phosphatase 2C domain-containing protein [Nannocystis bainbridge]MDC0719417.1 protein phosphatase 2C domain-containing protein [Nannocystis bainbridge]